MRGWQTGRYHCIDCERTAETRLAGECLFWRFPLNGSSIPEREATADVGQTRPALGVRFQNAARDTRQILYQALFLPITLCLRWADLDGRGHLVYPDLVVFARDPNHHDVRDKILRQ